MAKNKQVHSFVMSISNRWIYFLLYFLVRFNFEVCCMSIFTLLNHIAFFEYQWCIFLHVLLSPVLLSHFIYHNIQFFHWLKLWTLKIQLHLDDFSGLLGNNVIQLPSEIFWWETEILSHDHMSENVFTIGFFNGILIFTRQVLVDPSGFEQNQFIDIVM